MQKLISFIGLVSCLAAFFPGTTGRAEEVAKKIPVTVNADKLDYDRANDVYTAEGNVKIKQDGMRLEADKVILNNRTGDASAEGKVYLQDKADIIRADRLDVNINSKAGIIYNGNLFMGKDNLHMKGEIIERKSESVYHVEKGVFTTCDEGEWYLKADEIDVDMNRYATGRGVSFNMIGLPVFYTPYLLFPVRRQTGLLIPEAGYNSNEGFLMKNSFFWALSDFQDMTFYSDYRARHGHGSAVEYRYVNSRDSEGALYYNYFNTFDKYRYVNSLNTPDGRWFLSLQHHEEIAEDLSVRADLNIVSDYAYFHDLERTLELRSHPYLDSNLFYVERWDTASLYLLGQYSTDLTQQSNDATVQKLPELRYTIFEERVAGPLHANFEGRATNFTQSGGDNIMRADFHPRLSGVFGSSGLTLTPHVGARATYYDRSILSASTGTYSSTEPTDRTYYYAGTDLNARFSRVYGSDQESGFGRIRHSIEPTLSYNYIPEIDQSSIPQIDIVDSIVEQNLLTASVINRLTARYKDASGFRTFDIMVFRLSESYDFKKARSENSTLSAQPRSELTAELYIKTPKTLTISAAEKYDTYTGSFTSSSESINFVTDTFRFNLRRQALHQTLLSEATRFLIQGVGVKLGRWDVNAQVWRDLKLDTITEQDYKILYASQCWGLGVSYVRKPGEFQYFVSLDLKGLGTLKF
jgi:LPS-assembly protein